MELPATVAFTRSGRHVLTLSPDASRVVYAANQQLYVRSMNDLAASVIFGTEGSDPSEPLFSPDGQWVAFWSSNELKKVPITGGTPVPLAAVSNPFGMSWSGDRILMGQVSRTIIEVPASGGAPKVLIELDQQKGEWAQSPVLVANGKAVLFTLRTGSGEWDGSSIVVQHLDTKQRSVILEGGTRRPNPADGSPGVCPCGHALCGAVRHVAPRSHWQCSARSRRGTTSADAGERSSAMGVFRGGQRGVCPGRRRRQRSRVGLGGPAGSPGAELGAGAIVHLHPIGIARVPGWHARGGRGRCRAFDRLIRQPCGLRGHLGYLDLGDGPRHIDALVLHCKSRQSVMDT